MQVVKYILVSILVILAYSCDGDQFLEDTPIPFNLAETDFTSNEALDDITRGAYFNLHSPGQYGVIDLLMYQDIASDILDLKTYSLNTGGNTNIAPLYDRDSENNDFLFLDFAWAGAYTLIYNTNLVINFYDNNEPSPDALQDQVPRIRGENYFLRALTYYLLSTTFAPPYSSDVAAPSVILRTTPTNSPTQFIGRATNEEVYRQIIADAKRAIDLLPEQYDPAIHRNDYQDRANRDAARFLLAKVYFHMGQEFWTQGFDGDGGAKEQIDALIASGRYPVESSDNLEALIFAPRGQGLKAPETVFYATYYFRNGWRAPRSERHYSNFSSGIFGRQRGLAFSKAAIDALDWRDTTNANLDQRYTDLFRRYEPGEDPAYGDEYIDPFNVWSNKFLNRTSNHILFRSAELYLMRSTIQLEADDQAGAVAAANVVRVRAGMPPFTELDLEELGKEWIREYAFEGRRLFFLQATEQDIPPGDRTGVGPIPYDDPSLVRKIPQVELSRNPELDN